MTAATRNGSPLSFSTSDEPGQHRWARPADGLGRWRAPQTLEQPDVLDVGQIPSIPEGTMALQAQFSGMILGVALLAAPALAADRPPPTNALPLSQILQTLEKQGQVAYFDDIEWEGEGYWEIKYVAHSGGIMKVKVDPVTGEIKK
jgi:hypothetical protein